MFRVRATAPGGWLTVAVPGVVLLVETKTSRVPDASALLAALHSSDPVPAALDILMADGFSAMPAFALLEHRGQSAHYFVRGDVELEFTGPGGARSASGAGVTTWNEQLISGVDRFSAAANGGGAGDALPLADGAVWGDRVEYEVEGARSDAPPSAAARSVETRELAPAEETLLPPALEEATIAGPLPAVAAAEAAATQLSEDSLPMPEGSTGYDHLFGVTMMKSVEAAAVRPHVEDEDEDEASVGPASALSAVDDRGDHDGLTMMSGDIAELRRRAAAAGAHGDEPAATAGESYQFLLELPDGRSEPLDRPVIVGRSPSASKVSGADLPKLVTIGLADPDISRNHVRFTVEGGTVVITDLHSRNGTVMSLPGRPPQKLREGEPTSALAGTIVDLGGGIRITVTEARQAAGH